MGLMNWSEAVQWLREQPDQCQLVMDCYYDDPLLASANRFWTSQEWKSTSILIGSGRGHALDLGAGRGIGSFALAKDGWQVTAVEPDESALVGAGAIRALAAEANLRMVVVGVFAEKLPFPDETFDLVYCRQALHHARDLVSTCREIFRVLKPGGRMVATREHVINDKAHLKAFLDSHPLHRHYGGENALLLEDYVSALQTAGFGMHRILATFDSPINYFPMTSAQVFEACSANERNILGRRLTEIAFNAGNPISRFLRAKLVAKANRRNTTPGRLYSFVCVKPRS